MKHRGPPLKRNFKNQDVPPKIRYREGMSDFVQCDSVQKNSQKVGCLTNSPRIRTCVLMIRNLRFFAKIREKSRFFMMSDTAPPRPAESPAGSDQCVFSFANLFSQISQKASARRAPEVPARAQRERGGGHHHQGRQAPGRARRLQRVCDLVAPRPRGGLL